jgi:hypothetical protein
MVDVHQLRPPQPARAGVSGGTSPPLHLDQALGDGRQLGPQFGQEVINVGHGRLNGTGTIA